MMEKNVEMLNFWNWVEKSLKLEFWIEKLFKFELGLRSHHNIFSFEKTFKFGLLLKIHSYSIFE